MLHPYWIISPSNLLLKFVLSWENLSGSRDISITWLNKGEICLQTFQFMTEPVVRRPYSYSVINLILPTPILFAPWNTYNFVNPASFFHQFHPHASCERRKLHLRRLLTFFSFFHPQFFFTNNFKYIFKFATVNNCNVTEMIGLIIY